MVSSKLLEALVQAGGGDVVTSLPELSEREPFVAKLSQYSQRPAPAHDIHQPHDGSACLGPSYRFFRHFLRSRFPPAAE